MQAIVTKYLRPTDRRGWRIKAYCERGSLTIGYPHELYGDGPHIHAANLLCEKFDKEDSVKYGSNHKSWSKPKACGQMPNGDYAHVFI